MDDYISYDEKQGVLLGKESKRKLASGDQVRVTHHRSLIRQSRQQQAKSVSPQDNPSLANLTGSKIDQGRAQKRNLKLQPKKHKEKL